ncbi:MAG: hypothetical protein ACEPOW_07550 [Bacteroidales bacterium]
MKKFLYFLSCISLILVVSTSCAPPTATEENKEMSTQTLMLEEDWNPVYFYVETQYPDFDSVFAPILNNVENIEGYIGYRGGIYQPGLKNTFGEVEPYTVYMIDVKKDTTFEIKGEKKIQDSILLQSKLNNTNGMQVGYFPIPGEKTIAMEDLMISKPENVKLISDYKGGLYVPEYKINTIKTLSPGKAYLFIFKDSVTLSLKDGAKEVTPEKMAMPIYPSNMPENWRFTPSPFVYFLSIPTKLIPNIKDGDLIGVFNKSGLCGGVNRIDMMNEYTILTIYADDAMDKEQKGLVDGEEIIFKVFHAADGMMEDYNLYVNKEKNNLVQPFEWKIDMVKELVPIK